SDDEFVPAVPGAYPADPEEPQPPTVRNVGPDSDVAVDVAAQRPNEQRAAPDTDVEADAAPQLPNEQHLVPGSAVGADVAAQQPEREPVRDTRTDYPIPGAFPDDHLEVEAEPANWPTLGQAARGAAEWVVDLATGVGRWVWRNSFGESATDPWSTVLETIHAAFSPEQMIGNALPILRDGLTGEGMFVSGALAGASYEWALEAYVTEVEYLGRGTEKLEHWLKRENRSQRSVAAHRGHRVGVTLGARTDEADSYGMRLAGSYQYG
ncbi:hypothetical protein ACW9HQ_40470, partial [Nocardia gipuzkoensis]